MFLTAYGNALIEVQLERGLNSGDRSVLRITDTVWLVAVKRGMIDKINATLTLNLSTQLAATRTRKTSHAAPSAIPNNTAKHYYRVEYRLYLQSLTKPHTTAYA